jgi:hypothetical protein
MAMLWKKSKQKDQAERHINGVVLSRFRTKTPDIREVWDETAHQQKTSFKKQALTQPKRATRLAVKQSNNLKKQISTKKRKTARVKNERFHGAKPVFVSLLAVALILVGLYTVLLKGSSDSAKDNTASDILGSTTSTEGELPRVTEPEFSLLFTDDEKRKSYEIVRNSPEGQPNSYVYIDQLGSVQLKVSQLDVSTDENLKNNTSEQVKKIAESFQATNIIQVDDTTVYHGLDDKLGIQSLVFYKDSKLVLIASEKKLPDDAWAGYISALK